MPLAVDPTTEKYLKMEPDYATLKTAFLRAQHLLQILKRIFSTDNIHRRILLQYCFGNVPPADIPIIVQNINTLADLQSYVTIYDVIEEENEGNKGVYAYVEVYGEPWMITFTENFHKGNLKGDDQAGVVIHEAGHVLLRLYDWFEQSAPHKQTFGPNYPNYKGPAVWSGYEHEDFHKLTSTAPHVTRYNADAYAVAAILAGRIEHLHTHKEIANEIFRAHAFRMTTIGRNHKSDHQHDAVIRPLARKGTQKAGSPRRSPSPGGTPRSNSSAT
ncbi:hypothetical protein BJ165DRAFT_1490164 [Panaeolus papilionaceus]|nr:hypothetical protein BJ165DRAFT_1490164 [Panaeolus papilionaceus]